MLKSRLATFITTRIKIGSIHQDQRLFAEAKEMLVSDASTSPQKADTALKNNQIQQFPAADSVPSHEDHLIELTLKGDESAFETLVTRHSRRVFSIARHFFRSMETVEDIVQETFAKAFFSLSSYRRGASFEQWLAKIAVNNCYDELRRRKKRNESLITDLSEDEEGWLESKLAHAAFEVHFSEAEREKAAEISDKLLSKLSIDDRMILILLHAENNSVREISQMMGWSEAKVKIRAFRARHALRKALARLQMSEKRKLMSRG